MVLPIHCQGLQKWLWFYFRAYLKFGPQSGTEGKKILNPLIHGNAKCLYTQGETVFYFFFTVSGT